MQSAASESPLRLDLALIPAMLALGFFAAVVEAARSLDPRMVVQGWTFAGCMLAIGVWYLVTYADGLPQDERGPYANDVVKAGVIASMFWGISQALSRPQL